MRISDWSSDVCSSDLVEADLLAALESGQLSGASLDVFATEPLPRGHVFWSHPTLVATPHDACDVSIEAVADTLLATAAAISAGQRPTADLDRTQGYYKFPIIPRPMAVSTTGEWPDGIAPGTVT